ncbi:YciI family protein [Arvimicrobium flavum]|uniref:YciI family protein n=1 Tax=Arvimicrobium flavum TaxID=3393320 RepID=UPI00237B60C5|nr:YciI family protein [Mesorhizobium shangrilense]
MQYLCLVYHDESVFERMLPEEIQTLQRDSLAHDTALEKAGRLVLARPLKRPKTARSVRVRAMKRNVTDGPFAKTKEQPIGFLLVNAGSMDEALEIAAEVPLAKTGAIEVRGVSFIGDPELQQD